MWEVVKSLKRKQADPPTAIKNKDGVILEDPKQIRNRYLEHFTDLLRQTKSTTETGSAQEDIVDLAFEQILEMAKNQPTKTSTKDEVEDAMKTLKKEKV